MNAPSWEDDAYCRDIGPELFHPAGRGAELTADIETAKALCRKCQVADQCLTFALDREGDADRYSRGGIWGGYTPQERAALRPAA